MKEPTTSKQQIDGTFFNENNKLNQAHFLKEKKKKKRRRVDREKDEIERQNTTC
jgi:hypothetical protein